VTLASELMNPMEVVTNVKCRRQGKEVKYIGRATVDLLRCKECKHSQPGDGRDIVKSD
jgi:hypothetical protein